VFLVKSVYFNLRNNLPKSGTFPQGHLYIYIYTHTHIHTYILLFCELNQLYTARDYEIHVYSFIFASHEKCRELLFVLVLLALFFSSF